MNTYPVGIADNYHISLLEIYHCALITSSIRTDCMKDVKSVFTDYIYIYRIYIGYFSC